MLAFHVVVAVAVLLRTEPSTESRMVFGTVLARTEPI